MVAPVASSIETKETWVIDPKHTLVEFSAKHMMFTTVKGRFIGVSGTIVVDAANPTRSSVEAEIDAATLESGDPQRDGHLKSPEFLDIEQYPTIAFRSTRVTPVAGDRWKVTGDLTIHGVTREVVLDTELTGRGTSPWGQEVAGYSATTSISRKEFGLTWNVALETGGVLVSDQVKISIDAEASKHG